jgi:hypothetical protein
VCPQLLAPGELAPGLHCSEFAARRQRLAAAIPPTSLAIIPAAAIAYITGVIPYPYRQEADFLYLTGLQQQAVAIIKTYFCGEHEYQLFVPQPNEEVRCWGCVHGQPGMHACQRVCPTCRWRSALPATPWCACCFAAPAEGALGGGMGRVGSSAAGVQRRRGAQHTGRECAAAGGPHVSRWLPAAGMLCCAALRCAPCSSGTA